MAVFNQPEDKLDLKDAADVERIMEQAVAAWRESPLMTGASLRLLIPLAEGMATLAREIQAIKKRLPREKSGEKSQQK